MKTVWLLAALIAPLAFAAPTVVMQTNHGDIVVELAPNEAPQTVKNFLRYVADDSYNGTLFHRVINRFVVQGGGYNE
ncbi:MAG: peptidylprolyl isomerase, partial [Aeromonas sp.]